VEIEHQPTTDPYQKAVWQQCLAVLRSELEWLREQLVKEHKQQHDSERKLKI
jgi:hypothetical protein